MSLASQITSLATRVATEIKAHLTGVDPHGDRAYADSLVDFPTERWFPDNPAPDSEVASAPINLGLWFYSSSLADVRVHSIWWFVPSISTDTTVEVRIHEGTDLYDGTVYGIVRSFTSPTLTPGEWNEFPLPEPLVITTVNGSPYLVSIAATSYAVFDTQWEVPGGRDNGVVAGVGVVLLNGNPIHEDTADPDVYPHTLGGVDEVYGYGIDVSAGLAGYELQGVAATRVHSHAVDSDPHGDRVYADTSRGYHRIDIYTVDTTLAINLEQAAIFDGTDLTGTLPSAAGWDGREFIVKNVNATDLTIATTDSQTVDGAAPAPIPTNGAVTFISDGANWLTIDDDDGGTDFPTVRWFGDNPAPDSEVASAPINLGLWFYRSAVSDILVRSIWWYVPSISTDTTVEVRIHEGTELYDGTVYGIVRSFTSPTLIPGQWNELPLDEPLPLDSLDAAPYLVSIAATSYAVFDNQWPPGVIGGVEAIGGVVGGVGGGGSADVNPVHEDTADPDEHPHTSVDGDAYGYGIDIGAELAGYELQGTADERVHTHSLANDPHGDRTYARSLTGVLPTGAAYTVDWTLATDVLAIFDGTDLTCTLPTAIGFDGRTYIVKNVDATDLTVATTDSQTVDGAAPVPIATNGAVTYISDGANWLTISDRTLPSWVRLTQVEYDALSPPDDEILYVIVG